MREIRCRVEWTIFAVVYLATRPLYWSEASVTLSGYKPNCHLCVNNSFKMSAIFGFSLEQVQ